MTKIELINLVEALIRAQIFKVAFIEWAFHLSLGNTKTVQSVNDVPNFNGIGIRIHIIVEHATDELVIITKLIA